MGRGDTLSLWQQHVFEVQLDSAPFKEAFKSYTNLCQHVCQHTEHGQAQTDTQTYKQMCSHTLHYTCTFIGISLHTRPKVHPHMQAAMYTQTYMSTYIQQFTHAASQPHVHTHTLWKNSRYSNTNRASVHIHTEQMYNQPCENMNSGSRTLKNTHTWSSISSHTLIHKHFYTHSQTRTCMQHTFINMPETHTAHKDRRRIIAL